MPARLRVSGPPGLARWLERAAPARARGEVAVALVSDSRIRALNRRYRRIDRPTDVLSFPADQQAKGRAKARRHIRSGDQPNLARSGGAALQVGPVLLGDIAIARGVAGRQAREAGHSLATELRVLALHGLLHLLGYDHERDGGAMRRVERRLLHRAGIPTRGLIERKSR